ncbi:DNA-binding protein, partial [Pseudoxanthomonas sp. SGD-10]
EGLSETVEYIKSHQEVVEKRYEFATEEVGQKVNDDFSFEL